ncbi:MAG TPA: hypothetical protein VGL86_15255 [Polyangia bacterium]
MRLTALALALVAQACGSDYWVRPDAAAGTGWVAARRVGDDTAVAIRDGDLRTWHTRRDGVRRVSGRFRYQTAFATLAIAFAEDRDSLGIDQALARLIGLPGAALALGGGGLLWLGWPINLRAEPIAAHPGVGEPPPPR